jgi:hypothetical protein
VSINNEEINTKKKEKKKKTIIFKDAVVEVIKVWKYNCRESK